MVTALDLPLHSLCKLFFFLQSAKEKSLTPQQLFKSPLLLNLLQYLKHQKEIPEDHSVFAQGISYL